MKNTFILIFLLIFSVSLSAQTDAEQEQVRSLVAEAIVLMDKGAYGESRSKLAAAKAIDPNSYLVSYELGYSYYLEEDWKRAAKTIKKTLNHPEVHPPSFSLLGNAYDYLGNQKKAIKAYQAGKQKFPQSSVFNVELGILEQSRNNLDAAVRYWEEGITIDPNYPSNYYHLARIFSVTTSRLWTVLYAETFINLERGSKRTEEISKLLLDTYRKAIDLSGDSTSVSFMQNHNMSIESLMNLELPATMTFGTSMAIATAAIEGEVEINTQSFHPLRVAFLDQWAIEEKAAHPHAMIDWLYTIQEAGHLEAYNNWVISAGDEVGLEVWVGQHTTKWEAFLEWFNANQLEITTDEAPIRSSF